MYRVFLAAALAALWLAGGASGQGCYGAPAGYGYSGYSYNGYRSNGYSYNGAGGYAPVGRGMGYAGPSSSYAAPMGYGGAWTGSRSYSEALPPPVISESRSYEVHNGHSFREAYPPRWSFAPSPVSYYEAPRRPLLSVGLNARLQVGGRRGGFYCPTCP